MSTEPLENGVIWVSSYPKSGNTWVRFVLTYLFAGGVQSSVDVDKLIPEAMMMPGYSLKLPDDSSVLLKTHWKMDSSLPMMDRSKGFIYLVRNPLDVMISQFYFNMMRNFEKGYHQKSDNEIKQLKNYYIKMFIQHQGNPLVGDGGGNTSWVDHVSSWMTTTQDYPFVVVRYEDMIADPVTEISRVAAFFRKQLDKDEITNIARKTSFKAMKKMEDKEIRDERHGFFYHQELKNAHNSGSRFMRKGRTGEGKQHIDSDLLQQFFDTFEESMEMMGYKINRKTGIVRTVPYEFEKVSSLPSCPIIGRVKRQ